MEQTQLDDFDRHMGSLDGLPDVVRTKPTTLRTTSPLVGSAQTFIVQTVRRKDMGDTIFLEYVDRDGSKRIVIPANVADTIARQRDALATMSRKKAARALMEERKEQGIENPLLRPDVREKAKKGLAKARAAKKKKRQAS
jgi:hypothetical protein